MLSADIHCRRTASGARDRRYLGAIATHVETGLLDYVFDDASIQSRIVRRATFDGATEEATWRPDATRLMPDQS